MEEEKMRELIPTFPRQIGFPGRKFIKDETTFYNTINKYNGLRTLFYSLYEFTDGEWRNFDKIFFDIDEIDLNDAIKKALYLHSFLTKNNLKHLILFSGSKGFHVYVFTTYQADLVYPKDVLFNAVKAISNKISEYNKLDFQTDPKVFGDVARLGRIPNTYHLGGKRYCIPISKQDLIKGKGWLKIKAQKQNFKFDFYGSVLFNLNPFDFEGEKRNIASEYPELNTEILIDDKIINNFPNFFKLILTDPKHATYDNRFWFAVYCRTMGFHPNICKKIAKKYWGHILETAGRRSKYQEFLIEALRYAYTKEVFLPNWILDTMAEEERNKLYKEV